MEVDILEELAKATETKTASSAQLPRFNFSLDDAPQTNQPTSSTEIKPETPTQTTAPTEIKKISAEDAQISGDTAAALLDTVTNGLASLAIHLQTKNKFTETERDRIEESDILDISDDRLSENDKRLKNKWRRIMKKTEKKLDALETSDKDQERKAKIFAKYFKATGQELSPGWLLLASLIEDVGGKLETIFLE